MASTCRRAARYGLMALLWTLPEKVQAAEPGPPLVLERTIPLTGVSGRIDHMAVDLRRGRLFVAELGNDTVDVVDLAVGKVIQRIKGLGEPQGVGYAPKADVLAIANAGDGSVRLFKGEDLTPMGMVSLGDDADNIRVDMRTDQLIVGYGSGGLAVINPASRSVVSDTKLAAHPEGFQLDSITQRAFVNVPDAKQVAVLARGKQVATWRVPGLRQNFPMAVEAAGASLATVFRSPARLVLLDAHTGAVMANLQICSDADDVFFDAKRHRIYVSCGEGVVDVVQQDTGGSRPLARVKTSSGARTSLFVPELDRLFVAERAGLLASDAAILVLRPDP